VKFMVTAYLMEKYGPLLTTEELAQVLKISVNTLYNKTSAREIDIPKIKNGVHGKNVRYFAEDVSAYLEGLETRDG